MTIEHARAHALPKPWGVDDLRPWNNAIRDGNAIGEIWYERAEKSLTDPSLLLKLLFTSQPLSIQVHPDDAFAHSIGLPRGKSEVWYVLSAAPEAKVALGLKRRMTPQQLSAAVDDGSIADLVEWKAVSPGDVIYVPAGTIHAIGAGLVIAELQQRSDATFRLFDYARSRELHVERAIAVANTEPAEFRIQPKPISDERTLLVSCPHFTFEKINLPPNSGWRLEANRETWLLVLSGSARTATFDVVAGDAVFAQSDVVHINTGTAGMSGLVAYTGDSPASQLLQQAKHPGETDASQPKAIQAPSLLAQSEMLPAHTCMETTR
jgi:mannose-6-phosphate isomerase